MGGFVGDVYVAGLLDRVNLRFGPNEAITEMIALQKEFDIFSDAHTLEQSFALLNLGPSDNWSTRRGWYKYLNSLQGKASDKPKLNGEARVIMALREHLQAGVAVPVIFTSHDSTKDDRVKVSGKPTVALSYSTQEYLTISLPMTPIEKDRMKRRAAPKRK
jgi:hypothetical protein